MPDAPNRKLLSICMAGRDDDYMPDFLYRLNTTLNFFARSLDKIGRLTEAEILITDWGSPTPLSKKLTLDAAAADICRFHYVPEEVIRQSQGGDNAYHIARACNVGLRRAEGDFVFITNPDQLLPTACLDTLLRVLRGEVEGLPEPHRRLLLVPRIQVPWQFFQREPPAEEIDRYLLENAHSLLHEPLPPASYWFQALSGFVLSRGANLGLRGLDERQSGWGWGDIDFAFRGMQERPHIYLSCLGIYGFHMEHPPVGRRHAMTTTNRLSWGSAPASNDEAWGLGGYLVQSQRAVAATDSDRGRAPKVLKICSVGGEDMEDTVRALGGAAISSHVARIMHRRHGKSWSADDAGVDALACAAWYSFARHPRRFLEMGGREDDGYAVVSGACPSVELFGVEQMSGDVPGGPLIVLMGHVTESGLKARFHLLNSEPGEGLGRVATILERQPVDLILVRRGPCLACTTETMRKLLGLLGHDGAIILEGSVPQEARSMIGEDYLRVRSSRGATTMFLKEGGPSTPAGEKVFTVDRAHIKSVKAELEYSQSFRNRVFRKLGRMAVSVLPRPRT